MSRQIKFRAWDKENKVMMPIWDVWIKLHSEEGLIAGEPEENFELMQYTGLKDKHGAEIYEGDIVVKAREREYRREVIKFERLEDRDGGIIMGFILPSAYIEDTEVIGNIYENPELLK